MSDDIPKLYVKNWHTFQHYKDRNPPWIKLHRSILNDSDFISMPEGAQYELIRVWILAASGSGAVPRRLGLLRQMTGLRRVRYLDLLIQKGFLSENASVLLAPCKHSARPETETETYKEEKRQKTPPTPSRGDEFELPSWIPIEAWMGFLEMRKKIKKPMTDRAVGLAISKLENLKTEGNEPGEVLNQSTMNCWQGLFPIKTNGGRYVNRAEQRSIDNAKACVEALRISAERDRQAALRNSGSDGREPNPKTH